MKTFISGLLLGGAGIYFDSLVVMGFMKLNFPLVTFALGVMVVLSLIGSASGRDRASVIGNVIGIIVGVLGTNYLRVWLFGASSVFAGMAG